MLSKMIKNTGVISSRRKAKRVVKVFNTGLIIFSFTQFPKSIIPVRSIFSVRFELFKQHEEGGEYILLSETFTSSLEWASTPC